MPRSCVGAQLDQLQPSFEHLIQHIELADARRQLACLDIADGVRRESTHRVQLRLCPLNRHIRPDAEVDDGLAALGREHLLLHRPLSICNLCLLTRLCTHLRPHCRARYRAQGLRRGSSCCGAAARDCQRHPILMLILIHFVCTALYEKVPRQFFPRYPRMSSACKLCSCPEFKPNQWHRTLCNRCYHGFSAHGSGRTHSSKADKSAETRSESARTTLSSPQESRNSCGNRVYSTEASRHECKHHTPTP